MLCRARSRFANGPTVIIATVLTKTLKLASEISATIAASAPLAVRASVRSRTPS